MDILEFKKKHGLSWTGMKERVDAIEGEPVPMPTLQAHGYKNRFPGIKRSNRYVRAYPGVTFQDLAKPREER